MSATTLAQDRFAHTIQALRPGLVQNVAFDASASAASDAVGAGTRVVRVIASADCWVKFGAAPVAAAADSMRLKADREEWFRVSPGDKVAALGVAGSGSLNLVEME